MAFFEILMMSALGSSGAGSSSSVEDLLRAWETGCEQIESYDVYVMAERKLLLNPDDNWQPLRPAEATTHFARQVRLKSKRRIEPNVSKNGIQPDVVVIWNGEYVLAYNSRAKEVVIEPALICTTPETLEQLDYETLYSAAVGELSRIAVFRDRPDAVVEPTTADGLLVLYAPTTREPRQFSPFGMRVWLDPAKNYLPVRLQHLLKAGSEEIVYVQWENRVEEVMARVWAPVESRILTYPPIEVGPGGPAPSQEIIVRITSDTAPFNSSVPESLFELEIPAGATVYDRIVDKRYVFGHPDDPASHLSELVLRGEAAVDELRLARDNLEVGARFREPLGDRRVLLGLATALLGFIVFYLYRRGRAHVGEGV